MSKLLVTRGDILPNFTRSSIDEVLQKHVDGIHTSHLRILYSGLPCVIARGDGESLLSGVERLESVGLIGSICDEHSIKSYEDFSRFHISEKLDDLPNAVGALPTSATAMMKLNDSIPVELGESPNELLDIDIASISSAPTHDEELPAVLTDTSQSESSETDTSPLDSFELGIPELSDDSEVNADTNDSVFALESSIDASDLSSNEVTSAVSEQEDLPAFDFENLSLASKDPGNLDLGNDQNKKPVEVGDLSHLSLTPRNEDEPD